ncbi:hypothetical protein [Boudabousia liubingyangii]|uniref:hypothetical protein n=1 Tax=Boudabousia liubingyangii TaxID=1921764 RepID=UPI000AEDB9C5|nr:hypothetical protein [Boudabousia liubingyangii]
MENSKLADFLVPACNNVSMMLKRTTLFAQGKPSLSRDPRFLLGVLIIVLSGILGAWLFAAQNQKQVFYEASVDLAPGTVLEASKLTEVKANLPNPERYLSPAQLTKDTVLKTAVHQGELVAKSATQVGSELRSPIVISLGMPLPASIKVGDRVDLWQTRVGDNGATDSEPILVAKNSVILALPSKEKGFGIVSGDKVEIGVLAADIKVVLSAANSKSSLSLIPSGE